MQGSAASKKSFISGLSRRVHDICEGVGDSLVDSFPIDSSVHLSLPGVLSSCVAIFFGYIILMKLFVA